MFSTTTAFSRERVQRIYQDAVVGASDTPRDEVAAALGRLLFRAHLAVVLWWLLDKKSAAAHHLRAGTTHERALPAAALTLRLPKVSAFILTGDRLFQEAMLGEEAAP